MSMLSKTKSIFIVGAKRTPFGSFGGSLKNLTATDLGTHATKAALGSSESSESNHNVIDPKLIQSIFFGNVIQSSPDAAYLARHIGLRSDCPISTPALTINRLCGSGFETVIQGISSIASHDVTVDHLVVCGGTENMSMAPLCVDGNASRWGIPLGKGMEMYDSLWSGLTDSYAGTPMAITAENLASKYNITREECDDYAILSQSRWKSAKESNQFDLEMAPIDIETKKKGIQRIDTDEHPRPDTGKESISKLKPVFQKEGVVTAANASGICDGAGAIILASEEAVVQHNLTPLARVVSYNVVGCEPTTMGIGPAPAIRNALNSCGLTISDIDRVEINEAFAAQYLACEKELDLDRNIANINGGAISIGHPLAASGSRILAHLANEYQRSLDIRYSVGAACIGGGQGIAIVLERA